MLDIEDNDLISEFIFNKRHLYLHFIALIHNNISFSSKVSVRVPVFYKHDEKPLKLNLIPQ